MLFTFHSIGPQTLHFPDPSKMTSRKRQFLSRNPHSLYIFFSPIQLKARKSAPSVSLVCKVAEQSEHYPQGISTCQASIDYLGILQELHALSWIHYSGNISAICFWWSLQTHIEKPLIWSQIAFLFWWVEGMCIQASTVIPGRALGQRRGRNRGEVWRVRGNRGEVWQLRIAANPQLTHSSLSPNTSATLLWGKNQILWIGRMSYNLCDRITGCKMCIFWQRKEFRLREEWLTQSGICL